MKKKQKFEESPETLSDLRPEDMIPNAWEQIMLDEIEEDDGFLFD